MTAWVASELGGGGANTSSNYGRRICSHTLRCGGGPGVAEGSRAIGAVREMVGVQWRQHPRRRQGSAVLKGKRAGGGEEPMAAAQGERTGRGLGVTRTRSLADPLWHGWV